MASGQQKTEAAGFFCAQCQSGKSFKLFEDLNTLNLFHYIFLHMGRKRA